MGKSKSNFTVNKSVLNFIHARDFFHEDDAHKYKHIVGELKYEPMDYGLEIPHFNMLWPDVDMLFGEMIGEYVKLDKEASGTFRRPWDCVHFEYYDNIYDWRLAIALEDTTFQIFSHISGAKNTLKEAPLDEFDYNNPEEWVLETHVNLRENDAIFYRPWLFKRFDHKLIHCYKLIVEP